MPLRSYLDHIELFCALSRKREQVKKRGKEIMVNGNDERKNVFFFSFRNHASRNIFLKHQSSFPLDI